MAGYQLLFGCVVFCLHRCLRSTWLWDWKNLRISVSAPQSYCTIPKWQSRHWNTAVNRIRCTTVKFLNGSRRELFTALDKAFFPLFLPLDFLSFNLSFLFSLTCRCLKSLVTELSHYTWVAGHSKKWNLPSLFCIKHEWMSVYYCSISSSLLHFKINFRQIAQPRSYSFHFWGWHTLYFREIWARWILCNTGHFILQMRLKGERVGGAGGGVRGWWRGRGGGQMIRSSSVKADELRKLVTSEQVGAQVDVLAEPAGSQSGVNAERGRGAGSERVHTDKARG